MRPVILLVGIVVIIAGVVLLEVPLSQSASKTVTTTAPAHFHYTERVPVLSSAPVAIGWSSNTSVTLVLRTCSSINLTASPIWSQCTGGANLTETGTSGSVSTTVPVGGYVWAVLLAPSGGGANLAASVHVTTPYTTEAVGLWALGAIIVIAGILLRHRKKPVAPAEPPPTAAGAEIPVPEPTTTEAPVTGPPAPSIPEESPGEEPLD
jgi:hypothetical protein